LAGCVRRGLRLAHFGKVIFNFIYAILLGWPGICGDVGATVALKRRLSNSSAGAMLIKMGRIPNRSVAASLSIRHQLISRDRMKQSLSGGEAESPRNDVKL
jgi:hypothetical protein